MDNSDSSLVSSKEFYRYFDHLSSELSNRMQDLLEIVSLNLLNVL